MSGAFQRTAFQLFGFQTGQGAAQSKDAGSAGGGGKRKKYVLDGKRLSLNRDELEVVLREKLTETVPIPEQSNRRIKRRQDREVVAAIPQYPQVRDMLLRENQIEAAQVLRRVAQKMAEDEDEREVEMLLI